MADQTVRVEDSSTERVALDLMMLVRQSDPSEGVGKDAMLQLYHECHRVVRGVEPGR